MKYPTYTQAIYKTKIRFWLLICCFIFLTACSVKESEAITNSPEVEGSTELTTQVTATIRPTMVIPSPTITSTVTPSFISTVDYLQIYEMPHPKFAIRDDIRDSETFRVIGRSEDGKFLQIEYSGLNGWVDSQYIAGSTDDAIQNLPVVEYQGHPTEMVNWKGTPIKTLCFDTVAKFVGDYSRSHPDEVPTPYSESVILPVLKYLDVDLVPVGKSCDATLHFDFAIDQKGRNYINQNTGERAFCYTGLNLTNRWSLTQGELVITGEEKSSRSTKEELVSCWPSAPYQDEQLYTSFAVIQRFWGDSLYPPLAGIVETAANRYLIRTADKLGKKGTALVPYLIEYTDDFILGFEAQDTLKKVTGQQFYDDQTAWLEWYASQPTSTPLP